MLSAESDWDALIAQHGVLFVKPAREGSSIGMSKASTAGELRAAFEKAQGYAGDVMAETFVSGDEYTVAILGDHALPSIKIVPATDFYDFDAKYVSDETQFFCPSGLSDAEEAELSALALRAFKAVGAAVWGRVDVMRNSAGQWQLLEVNTIPGMTETSLLPKSAAASGISFPELCKRIAELSLSLRA